MTKKSCTDVRKADERAEEPVLDTTEISALVDFFQLLDRWDREATKRDEEV